MDSVRSWLRAMFARARRIERRELREFREWLEHTSNLLHVSMLVFVPLLIGAITYVSNQEDVLPFLLFPPLASGTYALFADPENRYASPRRFVGGTTAGALCGWLSLVFFARYWYHVRPEAFHVYAGAAAFAIALTGIVTWGLDIEEPTAFSTALLVLVSGSELVYVLSVAVSTTLVAGVFVLWHRRIYERRGEYLYRSTKGDDHVLVPMRGDHPDATATLGARLAGAHDAGKVVLLDIVEGEQVARAERDLLDETARDASADVAADGGWEGPSPRLARTSASTTRTPAETTKAATRTATTETTRGHGSTPIPSPAATPVPIPTRATHSQPRRRHLRCADRPKSVLARRARSVSKNARHTSNGRSAFPARWSSLPGTTHRRARC